MTTPSSSGPIGDGAGDDVAEPACPSLNEQRGNRDSWEAVEVLVHSESLGDTTEKQLPPETDNMIIYKSNDKIIAQYHFNKISHTEKSWYKKKQRLKMLM